MLFKCGHESWLNYDVNRTKVKRPKNSKMAGREISAEDVIEKGIRHHHLAALLKTITNPAATSLAINIGWEKLKMFLIRFKN